MDTLSVAQVARELGVSVPRVQRAIRSLGIQPEHGPRGRRLGPRHVQLLRERLGAVPSVRGVTRETVMVLAALDRRPFGVRSARAIARQTGLSPTTTSKVIKALVSSGLVTRSVEVLAEGRAKTATVYYLNRRAPAWPGLANAVCRTELPKELSLIP